MWWPAQETRITELWKLILFKDPLRYEHNLFSILSEKLRRERKTHVLVKLLTMAV